MPFMGKCRRCILLLSCLLCAFLATAWGQIFKWVDANGVTHYGTAPPPGVKAEPIAPAAPLDPAAASKAAEQRRRALSQAEEEAARAAQGKAREEAERQARQKSDTERLQRCAEARQQLDVVTQGGPVFRLGPQGQRQYLPDPSRDGEIARLRAEVAAQCPALESDGATRARWREINNYVLCDKARSLLRGKEAGGAQTPLDEVDRTRRLVSDACAPGRFPPDTGQRGEWFRQYVLPDGE
jgi:hypothetical protein